MNKDQYKNLVELCEALEGDHYEQGQSCLRTSDNKYCCLGVALDIKNPSGWQLGKCRNGKQSFRHEEGCDCADGSNWYPSETFFYMSRPTMDYFGLWEEDCKKLALMNDEGKTFKEIALYIRENILPRYKEYS